MEEKHIESLYCLMDINSERKYVKSITKLLTFFGLKLDFRSYLLVVAPLPLDQYS